MTTIANLINVVMSDIKHDTTEHINDALIYTKVLMDETRQINELCTKLYMLLQDDKTNEAWDTCITLKELLNITE